jgi:dihydrofolate reductase
MSTDGRVVLYIASSLDGFIARENGDIDWLSAVQVPDEDYGYHAFIQSVGTVIMGRKTYEKVLGFGIGFPHKGKKCYVLSRSVQTKDDNVEFFGGDIGVLVEEILRQRNGDIFVDGGADVVHAFLERDLIDRFVISVVPILLGGGIPLFRPGFGEMRLVLRESKPFPTGLVQNVYERLR